MRRLSRCVLLALLAAFSAVPAAAGPITVGSFYFMNDEICDFDLDPDCAQPVTFQYFVLDNLADLDPLVEGLTFSAKILLNGSQWTTQFDPAGAIASFDSVKTENLFPFDLFAGGARMSLLFDGGNFASFGGTLRLSNDLYDDVNGQELFASVEFVPSAVPDVPSVLIVLIGVGALAVGRAFLV